jgi:hypothetical protein
MVRVETPESKYIKLGAARGNGANCWPDTAFPLSRDFYMNLGKGPDRCYSMIKGKGGLARKRLLVLVMDRRKKFILPQERGVNGKVKS